MRRYHLLKVSKRENGFTFRKCFCEHIWKLLWGKMFANINFSQRCWSTCILLSDGTEYYCVSFLLIYFMGQKHATCSLSSCRPPSPGNKAIILDKVVNQVCQQTLNWTLIGPFFLRRKKRSPFKCHLTCLLCSVRGDHLTWDRNFPWKACYTE